MKIKYSDCGSIPSFLEAVAQCCLSEMTEEVKQTLCDDSDPFLCHFHLGLYIRNELIYPQRALLPTATEADRIAIERLMGHADDYCQTIVNGILADLRGE